MQLTAIHSITGMNIKFCKNIVVNKIEIPKINLYFSTDLRQNEETLDKTLVEFKLVDGKYKMENVEVKLLGI